MREKTNHSMLSIDGGICHEYLYIVQCSGTDYYKIGKSTRPPKARLSGLQVGCPIPLFMIHVFVNPGIGSLEKSIHRDLQHCRTQGEWFELKPLELVALVRSIADRIEAEQPVILRAA